MEDPLSKKYKLKGIKSEKAFELTAEMQEAARAAADPLKVCSSLSEFDQLLGYLINVANPGFPLRAVHDYIVGGGQHANQLARLSRKVLPSNPSPKVLEFASGYGRITRHLVKLAPDIDLSASDIHSEACDFIEREIGVRSFVSSMDPKKLDIEDEFDFIFVISLFSHLPRQTFGPWLQTLYSRLKVGGYLMFTTHGQGAYDKNPSFWRSLLSSDEPGYGFNSGTDQRDIDTTAYGTTLALPIYVMKIIKEVVPDAQLVRFNEGEWFSIQDEWVIRRS